MKKNSLSSLWEEVFTQDKTLYSRAFYLFGLFSLLLVFLSFFAFFLYFLAEPTEPPKEVQITNITDHSLTITWKTDIKTKGLVIYAPATTPKILRPIALLSLPSNLRAFDYFSKPTNYHSVTINKLSPNTYYIYRISTGLRTYKIDSQGVFLPGIKTAPALKALLPSFPLYGQVLNTAGQPIKDCFTYLYLIKENRNTPQSSFLSTFTNENGYYFFDLKNLRSRDLENQPEINNFENEIKIVAENESGKGEISVFTSPGKIEEKIIIK